MAHQALPGFRDFYPDQLAVRSHVLGAMRRVALRYGFEEYDGPPLEGLDLYTAKSGEEIVGQLYHFVDRGGRQVALRPEMTPTLARMVAPRAAGLKKPIRWFSIPQLFRYERQQRGRLREHFQLNCDLIGEPGPLGDAEIIALAIDVMRELGLGPGDVRVRLSDRRVFDALLGEFGVGEDRRPLVYQAVDKLGRRESPPRRDGGGDEGFEPFLDFVVGLRSARTWAELERALAPHPASAAAAGCLRDVVTALDAMGLVEFVDLDLSVVRGLAYYTGTVFELFDAGGSLRAICGGGRYDDLLAALGGVDLPALGFGMGDVVLAELLKDRGRLPASGPSIDVFIAGVTAAERFHVLGLAHRLRDAGLRVEYALSDQAVGKQLKLADGRGARLAVVIGPDDRARGEVMVKDLDDGSQRAVADAGLEAMLCERIGRAPAGSGAAAR
jgi:histidyl-tRNA synthetase